MLWTHQNKVLEDINQTVTNTLMTASWHVVAELLIVSRMSKVDYQSVTVNFFYLLYSLFFLFSSFYFK